MGTLETWAESKISEHRWRLQFQLRKTADSVGPAPAVTAVRSGAVVSAEAQAQAEELIEQVFGTVQLRSSAGAASRASRTSTAAGAALVAACDDCALWPTSFWRLPTGRRKNAAHEARWLNLTGFCLRPGFGFPGDDFRIEQARRIYAGGLTFGNQVQCEIDWWIFCGRIAGGLNRNQQADIFQRLSPILLPKQKRTQRINQSLYREMWRTAASLELLPQQTKTAARR